MINYYRTNCKLPIIIYITIIALIVLSLSYINFGLIWTLAISILLISIIPYTETYFDDLMEYKDEKYELT